jgi:LacI family transcriptional regulator
MDWRAHAVIGAAATLGLSVPGQLSVVGMYDTPWAEACRPTLTSTAFSYAFMAGLALSCLDQGAPASVRRILVKGDLVTRGSTAPPVQG